MTAADPVVEILIAEDSLPQAQLLTYILETHGYRVVCAVNGRLALEAARRHKPSLIISDIVMPEMDGYDLCCSVKTDADLRSIPVILVTYLQDRNDVIRGLECGADNFILKPYDEDFLIGRVEFSLANRGTVQPAESTAATEIVFEGKKRLINAGHAQVLNLLMSIYDAAMWRNKELAAEMAERDKAERALRASQAELNELNVSLDRLVTERTAELREATRRHVTLLGNLPGMAYRSRDDRDRTMEFVSDGCRELLGVAAGELTGGGIGFGGLMHPDDRDRVNRTTQANLAARVRGDIEYRVRHADGSWRWVWERSQGIYARNGKIEAVEGFIADVTERQKIEQQLRASQRMDAIGRLTGGLAHDLNNYLAVIIGNLDMLAERAHVDPEVPKLIDGAIGGAVRGAELTRSLLAFSRLQPLDPKLTDAGKRVGDVVKLLKRTLGENITIGFGTAANLWRVKIDGAQLDSCIVNLANNARDAMPNGGSLTIALTNVAAGNAVPGGGPAGGGDEPVGDSILIEITDSGAGMSGETLAQAFEPFFTTKGTSHGTGLGLSMVHGFVHQSGGVIRITSAPGNGTTVRIYLPRVVDLVVVAAEPTKIAAPVSGNEHILLVEDNEHVRATATGQLISLGYSVIEAASGDAALALLEGDSAGIDLIFTDIVMPGRLDGYALAKLVRERWPSKKVLLTSGFSAISDDVSAQALGLSTLCKPYRKVELARAVRAALS